MNFIKKIFKKKPYTFLGRAGISFYDGEYEFYINTNDFLSDSHEIEVFYEDIRLMDNSFILTDFEKKKIAFTVKKILEKDDYNVVITPPLPMDFIIDNS